MQARAPRQESGPRARTAGVMETKAKRTLVKSAPELWELANDPVRMEGWIADLIGVGPPPPIEVTEREPGRTLAWQTANGGPAGRIALELTEKGFGTSVRITAQHAGGDGAATVLERLLDELGSPERRPFTNA